MYFRKYPHPANFAFMKEFPGFDKAATVGRDKVRFKLDAYEGDVFRLRVKGPAWKKNYSQAGLKKPRKLKGLSSSLELDRKSAFCLKDREGQTLLRSPEGMFFGLSGKSSMFMFNAEQDFQYYGMGEKMRGLELSGQQTKFWNTDVFADFHWKEIFDDRPDPMYVSVPYVIIKRQNTYIGILQDNPFATSISTGAEINVANQMALGKPDEKYLILSAEHGQPDLYFIVGPSLPELTRKLQKLVGVTPRPPAWSLGYHQCRWGYESISDLRRLDKGMTEHGIPCDGLWIDIDFMDGYRVFTFNDKHFPKPRAAMKEMKKKGRRVVPIIDPGVKKEPGYSVYESGRKADIYCRNPAGEEFTGLVWPGETVFPDFSTKKGRAWWAEHVKQFAGNGFDGCWVDMNDPSTGPVQCTSMLFNKGRNSHYTFHNQYGMGMARATREGFEAANPNQRPFVLSRSGFTGMSKYAALWTGDNCSNYHYLRNCLAVTMNLSLSGVPFNGPDIGGFAGDTWPQLIQDWMRACFLFPFCRNHTATGTKDQEPWAFDKKTLRIMKEYIRMRYRLRPYLYNLFIRQEREGEAILSPLFYHFADRASLPLGWVDDQVMVGPSIMQAPVLDEHNRERDVVLPHGAWYGIAEKGWLKGGRRIKAAPGELETPVYFPAGAIIPYQQGDAADNRFEPGRVEFHLVFSTQGRKKGQTTYTYDDGKSLAYRSGKESEVHVEAQVRGRKLFVTLRQEADGAGVCEADLVLYDMFDEVVVNGKPSRPRAFSWKGFGTRQALFRIKKAL